MTPVQVPSIEEILSIDSEEGFARTAMELFRFQAQHCAPYREYLSLAGISAQSVASPAGIPFLPIELFKSHRVYCGPAEPEIVFTSSATSGTVPSSHYMAHVGDYEKTFRRAFSLFYGDPAQMAIYALLPGYLQRKGSSLVYMADRLIRSGNGGGFYLDDYDRLLSDISSAQGKKIVLGVTYALLDLAERHPERLREVIVMETGGMKGRREELPKEKLHEILRTAFGVEAIHSEYGMAELTSQAYSQGEGIFHAPPWMRVCVRDLNDPFEQLPASRNGGINIIDLANRYSCAFIQTQDVGTVYPDGSFRIMGRADRSEIRGCNLLVQPF